LSITLAQCDAARVFGRHARALYAVWSNPAPGVSPERFRGYYEDVHRPDTLAIGHFDTSYRYEAQSECRARYLTLWEAEYPDLPRALDRVRAGALALQKQGRIWPVQEVVFHQFLFAPGACEPVAAGRVAALTTAQNDWSAPARGEDAASWADAALPDGRERDARYAAQFLYTAAHAVDAHAGRHLWLGESADPVQDSLWHRCAHGLAPLGRPVPIFPPPDGDPGPDVALSDARGAAWVVHWTPIG
jgi:hypothetical protein